MSKFLNTTTRTIAWFKKTHDKGELQMKPPFQRNPVWTEPQKRYLIDSVLNGYPIPEIYMQDFVDETGQEKHIIIDGQQRIRSCMEFIEGDFALDPEESPAWANMKFDDLSPDDKKKTYGYIFMVRVLPDMPDEEIRGIFQRLNKNVVALNAQELRQATYWGPFIKTMQEIANYNYWSSSGIFTPSNIRRMLDIEYISELSIAVLNGHQNKKETLDKYYLEYETEFDSRDELIETFQKVLFEIEQVLPDIKNTRWKKKTDFYSLFIYLSANKSKLPLPADKRGEFRRRLFAFEGNVNNFISTEGWEEKFDDTVAKYAKSIRASSDLGNRKRRHEALDTVFSDIFSVDLTNIPASIKPMQENIFSANESEEE